MTPEPLTRRERFLVAVWEAWRDGRPVTIQQLANAAGYASKGRPLMLLPLDGALTPCQADRKAS